MVRVQRLTVEVLGQQHVIDQCVFEVHDPGITAPLDALERVMPNAERGPARVPTEFSPAAARPAR
jgi:hypothetical protein